jgi:hypothetical protein
MEAILQENLGRDDKTDILLVSLTALSGIESSFTSWSVEMEDAMLRLDKEMEHLLTFIDEEFGKENVLLFITSVTKGFEETAQRQAHNIPAAVFETSNAMVLLKAYLNAVLGPGEWVQKYHHQQIYLNRQLIEDSRLKLNDVQHLVALFMLEMSGVARAITSLDLQTNVFTDPLTKKIQHSFFYKKSGDVYIHLQPGWVEKNGREQARMNDFTHPVPLMWYGWKVKRTVITDDLSLFDVAPTLSEFLKIPFPNGNHGSPIRGLID